MNNKLINNNISNEQLLFLNKQKNKKKLILIFQIGIVFIFLLIWELSTRFNLVDSFLISSPIRVFKTILNLNKLNQFWDNILITFLETLFVFAIGNLLGFFVAFLLWWFEDLEKIFRPYLVILNSFPKIAIGPVIIVWMGAGFGAIIVLSLFMSTIISIINLSTAFKNVDKSKIFLMKTFGASKLQIFYKIVLPINIMNIMSTMRISIGMSLIGVITGEFLVSKKGLGYLIIYGGQVFKLDLVITSVLILCLMAFLFYYFISKIEFYIKKIK